MPDPLRPPWSQLIQLIPVADHSASVHAVPWRTYMAEYGLQNHHQAIFGGNPTIRLTRGRLLNYAYPNQQQKCLEILMWGWPTRNRGSLRTAFLQNLNGISETAPQNVAWSAYYNNLHTLGNLGISAITKLAYFYGHRFGTLPSLILDSRIIDALAAGRWQGLAMPGISYNNAVRNYPIYLQTLSGIAGQLGCAADQIELLLFSWGDAF